MTGLAAELRELAAPISRDEKIIYAIARAGRRAGLSKWRAFDIWYGKARRIDQSEREAVATALEQKRRESARNELQELRLRLTRLESLLVTTDPDFHRPTLDQTRDQLRQMGGTDGTADRTVAPARKPRR